jgi:O-antigen/teichoic acid export membrane protein
MSAQYASFIIQFVASVIISRYFLAPAEVGLFSIALALAIMISVLQDFGITRYVAGQPNVDERKIRVSATIAIVFAWGVAALILAVAWPMAHFYGDMRLVPLLALIAASYLLTPFGTVSTALLARAMDYRSICVINVGSALAGGVTMVGLAAYGFSASSLAWAMIVQAAVKSLLAQSIRPIKPTRWLTRVEAVPILKFGSASMALSISGAIGMKSQDLVVGRMFTLGSVGIYSRATGLSSQMSVLVTGAINAVFYPAFARLRDNGEALGAPYVRVVAGNTAINWAAMAGLSVAAEPLIRLLYGERWVGAAPLLQWIALAEMCFVALPMHMDMPILLGRIKSLIRYNALDTFVSISLLILAAHWGLEWAAISRLGYGLIWIFIYAGLMRSLIKFEWRAMFSVYAKSAVSTLAAITPMLMAYHFWLPQSEMSFGGLLLCAGTGVACWIAALFLLKHPARLEVVGAAQTVLANFRR